MIKLKLFTLIFILTGLMGVIRGAYGQEQLKFIFVAVDAKITGMDIPGERKTKEGKMEQVLLKTGPISATIARPSKAEGAPVNTLDLKTGKVHFTFPMTVTIPGLKRKGLEEPLFLNFVGTGFLDRTTGEMFLVDVAHFKVDTEDFRGDADVTNNNKAAFDPADLQRIEPGKIIRGQFTTVRPDDQQRYPVEQMLRESIRLAGIKASEKEIRSILQEMRLKPTKELFCYFPKADTITTADLEGTVTIQFLK